MTGAWSIRKVDPETVRAFKDEAWRLRMTLPQLLAALAAEFPVVVARPPAA